MTFNELLKAIEGAGHKVLGDRLYEYILINFKTPDFDKAAQMITDLIVNWDPQPVYAESWVMSQDFAYAQNFAQLMRARGILPPPVPVIEGVLDDGSGYELILEESPTVTTEYLNDR